MHVQQATYANELHVNVQHKDYLTLINSRYEVWVEEFKDIHDPRLFWDLIKYKIRKDTISYSKCKARER